tara:strand:- start:362 stop:1009 length:648 start_codon:yes stop_codon:yes gene_type:complete
MIKYFKPLTKDQHDEIIDVYNAEEKDVKPWRKGASYKRAYAVVRDYVSENLGHENWECNSGNFFETLYPYRLHADTTTTESNYQNIVFPLSYDHEEDAALDQNVLYIFKQMWYKEGTMFLKGSPPSKEGSRHNTETREYSTVTNIEEGYIDKVTAADCDHLPTENFEGMSVAAKMLWEPGKPFTFSRNAIHCSNNWHRIGIKSKLGLSLFTRSTS